MLSAFLFRFRLYGLTRFSFEPFVFSLVFIYSKQFTHRPMHKPGRLIYSSVGQNPQRGIALCESNPLQLPVS
jgi:hypothetical protein